MEILVAGQLRDLCLQLKKKSHLTQVPDYREFLAKLRESTYDLVVMEGRLPLSIEEKDPSSVGYAQMVPLVKQLQSKAGIGVLLSAEDKEKAPDIAGALILSREGDQLEALLESVPLQPRKLPGGTTEIVWGKGETIHLERGSSDPELRNDLTAFLDLKGRQLAKLCGESDYFGTEWTGPEHQSLALSRGHDHLLAMAQLQEKALSLTENDQRLIGQVFGVRS